MAPSEYESLAAKIDSGFEGVHERINEFKGEFNSHRLSCAKLFEDIHVAEATRKGEEQGIARNLSIQEAEEVYDERKIDWGKWSIRGFLGLIALQAAPNLFEMVKWFFKSLLGIK